jgi:hypothetical protein
MARVGSRAYESDFSDPSSPQRSSQPTAKMFALETHWLNGPYESNFAVPGFW